jgi:mRNA-degrading endonuclease RelE of RelBE toxin-antitoxin system
MTKQIEFTSCGEREFKKLPRQLQKRIIEKIELYIHSGNPMFFAKPLINIPPATHRFRVGKYRICFYLQSSSIVIDGVDSREDAYRRK